MQLPEVEPAQSEPLVNQLNRPIWTANKARLIEEYLQLFVLVTWRGTYIDGFAGPQKPEHLEMWSAKRVLESQQKTRRIRHYHLFETNPEKCRQLEALKVMQPADPERTIDIYPGDFNVRYRELIDRQLLKKEPTFCLLDQRTFECHWSTVKALSEYKTGDRKMELFYFLAIKWLCRSLKATTKNVDKLQKWWGRSDWKKLQGMSSERCADEMVTRFKEELGYLTVKRWPIFATNRPGTIMYYMIHAADHEEAPKFMRRAYEKAVTPVHVEQLGLF